MPFPEEAQLNEIIDEALALPSHQRQAFLRRACPNPEVLAKAEALLESCETEVPEEFLRPTEEGKNWIENVYRKLKQRR
ncbi:MAG: hypothetical protein AAF564_23845 [Bacteroidota bacterium]